MIKKIKKTSSSKIGTKVIMNGITHPFLVSVPQDIVIDFDNDTVTYLGKDIKSMRRTKQQTPSEWLEAIKAKRAYKRLMYHPIDQATYLAHALPTYIQID